MSVATAKHILLIEDNEQNAYLARYILEHGGFIVSIYNNASAGINAATEHQPDLVLLDIQLPDLDGYAVATQLRHDPRTGHIPLVALSSFAMPGEKARALEAGCIGYIEKPIKALNLVAQVKEYLRTDNP